jgi:ArsR family transcriptional regulator
LWNRSNKEREAGIFMKKYIKIFSALSDQTRLRIYMLLTEGELCVCELTCALDMEQSRISHSLKILKEAGLIYSRRVGKWMFYSLSSNQKYLWISSRIKENLKTLKEDKKRLKQCRDDNIREKYQCQIC